MSQSKQNVKGKSAAIISYLFFFLGSIIAISMNMEKRHDFARFHIRQSFGLHFIFIALAPLPTGFNNWTITLSLYIFYSILWLYGFIAAISGKKQLVPVLGSLFQKLFKVL